MPNPPIVGFITPPAWFDPAPREFADLCAAEVSTQQTFLNLPDLDFDNLEDIAAAEADIGLAGKNLRLAGATAIGFNGTPFTWAGLKGEAEIRARLSRIEQGTGCQVVMPGTAMIDVLRDLSAKRIALFAPYYTPPWLDMTKERFQDFGLDVALCVSASGLGIVPEISSIDDHEVASSPDVVLQGLKLLAEQNPSLDAIAIPGAGIRTAGLIEEAETMLGLPLVPADVAVYWALAKALALPFPLGHYGRLISRRS